VSIDWGFLKIDTITTFSLYFGKKDGSGETGETGDIELSYLHTESTVKILE
jgi:hypothetical protein